MKTLESLLDLTAADLMTAPVIEAVQGPAR